MIFVIATIQLADGQRDEFLNHFHELVPQVREEEGCLEYLPTTDIETNISAQAACREDVVTVVEKWESIEALEAHLIAPHMLQYREKVKSLVKQTSLQILQPA